MLQPNDEKKHIHILHENMYFSAQFHFTTFKRTYRKLRTEYFRSIIKCQQNYLFFNSVHKQLRYIVNREYEKIPHQLNVGEIEFSFPGEQ